MEKEIKSITMENCPGLDSMFGKIERFERAGEMANVGWYRQGNVEVQEKYVARIEYKDEP